MGKFRDAGPGTRDVCHDGYTAMQAEIARAPERLADGLANVIEKDLR